MTTSLSSNTNSTGADARTTPTKPPAPSTTKFQPYKNQTIECVLGHFLLEPLLSALQPVLQTLYRVRFWLAQPLSTRILPKWTPRIPIPRAKFLTYATFGELLLTLPLVALLVAGYYLTFISPSINTGGSVAGYAIILTYLTASKSNSLIAFVLGIPFERMIGMHTLCSLVSVVLGILHTYAAYEYGGSEDSNDGDDRRELRPDRAHAPQHTKHCKDGVEPSVSKFLVDGEINTSGTLVVTFILALVTTSFFPIFRRYCFNLWLLSHIGLAMALVASCGAHSRSSVYFIVVWWIVDCVVRYVICARCRYPKQCELTKLRNGVVRVSFPKPPCFTYRPGQFVQIALPALSVFEFHPVSLSSAPHEPNVTLHIRALGDWSRRLMALAEKQSSTSMLMEGPYGNLSVDIDNEKRNQVALLVCGGIGVTHCQSVGKSLLYDHYRHKRSLRHVRFVWAVRDLSMVEDMPVMGGSERLDEFIRGESGRSLDEDGDTELGCSSRSMISATSERSPVEAAVELENNEEDRRSRRRCVVETDIYLTKTDSDSIGTAMASSSVPSSNTTLHAGRPDVNAIFSEMKQVAIDKHQTHVMVFGCGPRALMEEVQEACRKHSDMMMMGGRRVVFDLHLETFEF